MGHDDAVAVLKLTVSYDGTAFWGSQRQMGRRTVQDELERCLRGLGFEHPATVFAGRTDRGVHAVGQVVRSEDGRPPWSDRKVAMAINATLPDDVAVGTVQRVAPGFHPRYDATWREYRYRIWCGSDQPLERLRVWNRRAPLDVEAMASAARLLIGTHDLAAFTGGGEGVPWSDRARAPRGTVRTIAHCGARTIEPWWGIVPGHGMGIEVRVIADGFLPQLVRTIVSALVEVGMGRKPASWITRLIDASDRRYGPETAPAHGLVLWRVGYDDDLPDPGPDGRQIPVVPTRFHQRVNGEQTTWNDEPIPPDHRT